MKTITLSPSIIYSKLSETVIGQEKVKRVISNAAFMHYVKVNKMWAAHSDGYGPKSNSLIIGPSGCGKTHTIKALEDIIPDIPVLKLDATSITKVGYVGNSLEDRLLQWKKEKGHIVEYGIVFIDEIDKICISAQTSKSEDYNKEVQYSLLSIIEGIEIYSDDKQHKEAVDTSNMLFIFGGNFEELRKKKREDRSKKGIGFKLERPKTDTINTLHKELIEAGLILELAGRISNVVEVKKLTRAQLKEIFYNEETGPYSMYQSDYQYFNEELNLSEYYINKVIDECYKSNLGARSIKSSLDNLLEKKIFEIQDIEFPTRKYLEECYKAEQKRERDRLRGREIEKAIKELEEKLDKDDE